MKSSAQISPYVVLIPVLAAVFFAADDQTVIVTVLPEIMLAMNVQITELDRASWLITGYLLGYVAVMPIMGRMSDVWGRRKLFIIAISIFMLGSVLVALSRNLEFLIATRIFQAVGAGALVPIAIAIVGDLFPLTRRGIPLGIVGACAEAGAVVGPLWGGLVTRYLDWQWVFWLNIPVGVLILLGIMLFLRPNSKHRHQVNVDYLGGIFITISLATLTLGLTRVGMPDIWMALWFVVSCLSLICFIFRQSNVPEPLIPLYIFKNWMFSTANFTHLMVGGSLIIGMVTIPLMADTILGHSTLEGGLRLMRMTVAIPVGAVLGGLFCQRLDYRLPTILGLMMIAIGFGFMSYWGLDITDPAMTIHLLITGFGFGLIIAPITLAATSFVDAEYIGTAAALVTAMRLVGMTFGLAALASWGMGKFHILATELPFPFESLDQYPGSTEQQFREFETGLTEISLTLFNDFFLIAMVISLLALIPASLMILRKR